MQLAADLRNKLCLPKELKIFLIPASADPLRVFPKPVGGECRVYWSVSGEWLKQTFLFSFVQDKSKT